MSLAVSMRNVDPAFQGAGQKAGLEIWRIEKSCPVSLPTSSYGKIFTCDSYIILKARSLPGEELLSFAQECYYGTILQGITFASKSGTLRHEIHYWLGKDTSQDEAGAAAVKTIELDVALGGRALQYREVQGNESDKFLSLFKPCIMPQEGGAAAGFKHVEKRQMIIVWGCDLIEVVDMYRGRFLLLDPHSTMITSYTGYKVQIFQFNGSNTSIQERAKALEVAQYIRDNYHDGECEITSIEDGKLMADAASGEFWALFGGFAPLLRKSARDEDTTTDSHPTKKLLSIDKGKAEPAKVDSLTRELLATDKCYILDCGLEVYVWMGRSTSLDERKTASKAAEELIQGSDRSKSRLICLIEGFETVIFRSKFESWPQTTNATVTEDGRGKVAALLQRQGLNVKGLLKVEPVNEDPKEHIDCTGQLQVWRVNGEDKVLLSAENQSKFLQRGLLYFSVFLFWRRQRRNLIGTWLGKQSIEKERASAISMANKMAESMKLMVAQACIHEGSEPLMLSYLIISVFEVSIVVAAAAAGIICHRQLNLCCPSLLTWLSFTAVHATNLLRNVSGSGVGYGQGRISTLNALSIIGAVQFWAPLNTPVLHLRQSLGQWVANGCGVVAINWKFLTDTTVTRPRKFRHQHCS
ncbi:Villin-5 [Hibiscus syriacus]|uniref:Villin-5 n=1 Tax=Hibiscus syriacus TaxID=106335 RepID=A0A6A2XM95_HIBSY|nr:Villin-5 [Hibiscus syriacus]